MNDTLQEKLAQRINRRVFLRESGMAAAAIAGWSAFPILASAQDGGPSAQEPAKDNSARNTAAGQTTEEKKDEKKEEKKEDKKDEKAGSNEESKDTKNAAPDPFKETRKDEQGRDYRLCPQCGYNMYKQDRTWTCENCGYSYAE